MTTATLDKNQLDECRQAYEQTPLILQAIGDRYGVSAAKIAHLARHHHWQRYEPPLDPERFERDVEEAVAYAENEGLAKALREAMRVQWQDHSPRPKSAKKKSRSAGKSRVRTYRKAKNAAASESVSNVVQFPGAVPPPNDEIAPIDIFNVRTASEQARLRIEIGELRGAMSLQQLQGLQRTRGVVDDYEHYFRVYLRPQDYIERGTQGEEAYQDRLKQLRKQALLYIAPTERDTLAGALKTLIGARETIIGLERLVSGAGTQKANRQLNPADGEPLGQNATDLASMDVATLRDVKRAMEALQGERSAASEPPKPPPPEPLNLGAPSHEPDDAPGR